MNNGLRNFNEKNLHKKFSNYVLGADVGGTNITLVIAGVENNKPVLLYSLNFKTKELDSLIPAIETTLDFFKKKHDIDVTHACIGAAGTISESNDYAELTNVEWNISAKEITNKTSLQDVFIINDFQAIGFGINFLDLDNPQDVIKIRSSNRYTISHPQTKVVIGAGTGLGKSILIYNKNINAFVPIHSEGGHSDFPVTDTYELELVNFIKKLRNIKENVTYEEVLSGRGLEAIYLFLKEKKNFKESKYTKIIDRQEGDKAGYISKYRDADETCKEVFRLFSKFYGRCVKNFVLDTMALGGVFLAGGISIKNKEIFTSDDFINEFENVYRRRKILSNIPVYVITNYDASLYGTSFAAALKFVSKAYDRI